MSAFDDYMLEDVERRKTVVPFKPYRSKFRDKPTQTKQEAMPAFELYLAAPPPSAVQAEQVNQRAAPSPIPPEPAVDPVFRSALREVENSVRKGWQAKTNRWKPHGSLEGGNATLAYGHKLTDSEVKSGTVDIDGKPVSWKSGLTEQQAQRLFEQDVKRHQEIARAGVPDFDQLDPRYQRVIVNIAFNTGKFTESDWPKLLKAARAGDDAGVRREMVTSFTDKKGKKHILQERANRIADALKLGATQ